MIIIIIIIIIVIIIIIITHFDDVIPDELPVEFSCEKAAGGFHRPALPAVHREAVRILSKNPPQSAIVGSCVRATTCLWEGSQGRMG